MPAVFLKIYMQMDFHILGSSSLGNSALLRTSQSKILIDAGFSGKRIESLLAELGESIHSIDAVFLTHEHQDHAQESVDCPNVQTYPSMPIAIQPLPFKRS